jgi:hypothetical protein
MSTILLSVVEIVRAGIATGYGLDDGGEFEFP